MPRQLTAHPMPEERAGEHAQSTEAEREQLLAAGAERSRRWRKRRKQGVFVVPVEVSGPLLDRFVGRRLMTDREAYDLDLLARRLAAVLDDISRGR